ncbi:MAG: response regulator [Candidatus Kapaibacterium sp.]|nr:response regulator [Bacteroidota bacterium]
MNTTKTILIADDSASIRKFVSLSLKMQGYNVISAVDGMDALEKLPASPIDMVITDLNMPNMDGYKLIRNIRSYPEFKELPIIILSSLSNDDDIKEGMTSGANSYLVKPFNAKRVQYEVSKYLG